MDQNPGMYTCPGCGLTRPSTTPFCPKCGRATDVPSSPNLAKTPAQDASPAVGQVEGQWICTKCNFVHHASTDKCGRCGSDKIVFRTKQFMQRVSVFVALAFILLVIIIGAPFYSCAGKVVDATSAINTEDKLVTLSWDFTNDGTYRYIEGIVQNKGTKKANYAQITFTLYDAQNNQVGTTLANTNNLEPNGTWKFKTMMIDGEVASAKISGITSW